MTNRQELQKEPIAAFAQQFGTGVPGSPRARLPASPCGFKTKPNTPGVPRLFPPSLRPNISIHKHLPISIPSAERCFAVGLLPPKHVLPGVYRHQTTRHSDTPTPQHSDAPRGGGPFFHLPNLRNHCCQQHLRQNPPFQNGSFSSLPRAFSSLSVAWFILSILCHVA